MTLTAILKVEKQFFAQLEIFCDVAATRDAVNTSFTTASKDDCIEGVRFHLMNEDPDLLGFSVV